MCGPDSRCTAFHGMHDVPRCVRFLTRVTTLRGRTADSKSRIEPHFIEHRHGVAIGHRPGKEPGRPGDGCCGNSRAGATSSGSWAPRVASFQPTALACEAGNRYHGSPEVRTANGDATRQAYDGRRCRRLLTDADPQLGPKSNCASVCPGPTLSPRARSRRCALLSSFDRFSYELGHSRLVRIGGGFPALGISMPSLTLRARPERRDSKGTDREAAR
jgi:hypothetical protein